MVIRFKTITEWWDQYGTWHDYYAWHPVFFDGGFAWFTHVKRRAVSSWGEFYWVYKI